MTMASTPRKPWYSVKSAAEYFGVTAMTVYRAVKSGTLPSKWVGGRLLIPGSEVEGIGTDVGTKADLPSDQSSPHKRRGRPPGKKSCKRE